jgi:hypothetical protein
MCGELGYTPTPILHWHSRFFGLYGYHEKGKASLIQCLLPFDLFWRCCHCRYVDSDTAREPLNPIQAPISFHLKFFHPVTLITLNVDKKTNYTIYIKTTRRIF